MTKILTKEDEDKVIALVESGYLRTNVAKRFSVSKNTINRLIKKRDQTFE